MVVYRFKCILEKTTGDIKWFLNDSSLIFMEIQFSKDVFTVQGPVFQKLSFGGFKKKKIKSSPFKTTDPKCKSPVFYVFFIMARMINL